MDVDNDITQQIGNMHQSTFSIFNNNRNSIGVLLNCVKKYLMFFDTVLNSLKEKHDIWVSCSSGCSYCCYINVDAKAHEILLIADFINSMDDRPLKDQILNKALKNKKTISSFTGNDYLKHNIECPMLLNNKCIIYPVIT